MAKKSKNKKQKKKIYIVLIIVGLLSALLILVKNLFPHYSINSRVDNIKKYKGAEGEKAISWLRVQGTNIDFPIVYYYKSNVKDPTYDLGWNYVNSKKKTKKTMLFSHNVLNISSNPIIADKSHRRFEQLMSFIYPKFLEKNKYIQYTVGGNDYLYKIYAVSFRLQDEIEEEYDITNYSSEEAEKYISDVTKKSYFKFDTDVNEKDDLLTLVTCTRFFGIDENYSFTVDARRVRKNERINNYGIKVKKNYNKIEKIMKGVDKDEEA